MVEAISDDDGNWYLGIIQTAPPAERRQARCGWSSPEIASYMGDAPASTLSVRMHACVRRCMPHAACAILRSGRQDNGDGTFTLVWDEDPGRRYSMLRLLMLHTRVRHSAATVELCNAPCRIIT